MEEIVDDAGLASAMTASREGSLFLFKHSTACPVSAAAFREVAAYSERGEGRPVYLVKVIESRTVSNAISKRTGVVHKSPQLILVDQERAIWDASHYAITAPEMDKAAAD